MFNEPRVLSIKIIIYKKGEIDGTKRKYVICYTTRIIGNSVKAEFFYTPSLLPERRYIQT